MFRIKELVWEEKHAQVAWNLMWNALACAVLKFLHLACNLACFNPKYYTLIVTGALFRPGRGLTHLVQYLLEGLVQMPDQADLLGM